jgi:hypothetical protein
LGTDKTLLLRHTGFEELDRLDSPILPIERFGRLDKEVDPVQYQFELVVNDGR